MGTGKYFLQVCFTMIFNSKCRQYGYVYLAYYNKSLVCNVMSFASNSSKSNVDAEVYLEPSGTSTMELFWEKS